MPSHRSDDPTIVFKSFFEEADLDCPITAVTICGNFVEYNKFLHYRLYFEIRGGEHKSIMFDMVLPSSVTGALWISNKDYAFSDKSQFQMRFAAEREVNMEQVLHLVKSRGRNRYNFDRLGCGCRYWCQTVLADLEDDGIIAPGSAANFVGAIQDGSAENPAWFPMPTRMGAFY